MCDWSELTRLYTSELSNPTKTKILLPTWLGFPYGRVSRAGHGLTVHPIQGSRDPGRVGLIRTAWHDNCRRNMVILFDKPPTGHRQIFAHDDPSDYCRSVLVFECYKFMLCFVSSFNWQLSHPPTPLSIIRWWHGVRNLNFEKGTASLLTDLIKVN